MEQSETEVVLQARGGDRAAARAVVESLRPELEGLVRALGDLGLDADAVAEELATAVVYAVRRYDERLGVSFVTYARHWMRACVVERQVRRTFGRARAVRRRRS